MTQCPDQSHGQIEPIDRTCRIERPATKAHHPGRDKIVIAQRRTLRRDSLGDSKEITRNIRELRRRAERLPQRRVEHQRACQVFAGDGLIGAESAVGVCVDQAIL